MNRRTQIEYYFPDQDTTGLVDWSPAAPLYLNFTDAEVKKAKEHFGWQGTAWTHKRVRVAFDWLRPQTG